MSREEAMRFFNYQHLPDHLQGVSRQFHDLAAWICVELPECRERDKVFDKLLEAKDAAVRARL